MPDTILHATMLFAFGFAGAPSSGKIPPLFPVPGKPVFFLGFAFFRAAVHHDKKLPDRASTKIRASI